MKILFSLVLLALISCGGGSGGSSSGSSWVYNITPPTDCGSLPDCVALKNFKFGVENNQWVQPPSYALYTYKFHYQDPTKIYQGCPTYKVGPLTVYNCINRATPTPVWTTVVNKGVFNTTNPPLVPHATILNIVKNAELWGTNPVRDPSKAYAYFDGALWTIELGSEVFVFDPKLPLGANPRIYKKTDGTTFSYSGAEGPLP